MADPGVTVTLEEAAVCPQALTEEATLRVVRYLLLVPNGIAAMSMDIPGLVQTSCNLGIFHVADGVLTAVSSVRSSVASQKQMLLARFAALSQLLGGSLQVTGAYPAWEYRRESVLREKMAAVYEQQTGKAPKIEAIHAGLECGLFAGQLPGLDCGSCGAPTCAALAEDVVRGKAAVNDCTVLMRRRMEAVLKALGKGE